MLVNVATFGYTEFVADRSSTEEGPREWTQFYMPVDVGPTPQSYMRIYSEKCQDDIGVVNLT